MPSVQSLLDDAIDTTQSQQHLCNFYGLCPVLNNFDHRSHITRSSCNMSLSQCQVHPLLKHIFSPYRQYTSKPQSYRDSKPKTQLFGSSSEFRNSLQPEEEFKCLIFHVEEWIEHRDFYTLIESCRLSLSERFVLTRRVTKLGNLFYMPILTELCTYWEQKRKRIAAKQREREEHLLVSSSSSPIPMRYSRDSRVVIHDDIAEICRMYHESAISSSSSPIPMRYSRDSRVVIHDDIAEICRMYHESASISNPNSLFPLYTLLHSYFPMENSHLDDTHSSMTHRSVTPHTDLFLDQYSTYSSSFSSSSSSSSHEEYSLMLFFVTCAEILAKRPQFRIPRSKFRNRSFMASVSVYEELSKFRSSCLSLSVDIPGEISLLLHDCLTRCIVSASNRIKRKKEKKSKDLRREERKERGGERDERVLKIEDVGRDDIHGKIQRKRRKEYFLTSRKKNAKDHSSSSCSTVYLRSKDILPHFLVDCERYIAAESFDAGFISLSSIFRTLGRKMRNGRLSHPWSLNRERIMHSDELISCPTTSSFPSSHRKQYKQETKNKMIDSISELQTDKDTSKFKEKELFPFKSEEKNEKKKEKKMDTAVQEFKRDSQEWSMWMQLTDIMNEGGLDLDCSYTGTDTAGTDTAGTDGTDGHSVPQRDTKVPHRGTKEHEGCGITREPQKVRDSDIKMFEMKDIESKAPSPPLSGDIIRGKQGGLYFIEASCEGLFLFRLSEMLQMQSNTSSPSTLSSIILSGDKIDESITLAPDHCDLKHYVTRILSPLFATPGIYVDDSLINGCQTTSSQTSSSQGMSSQGMSSSQTSSSPGYLPAEEGKGTREHEHDGRGEASATKVAPISLTKSTTSTSGSQILYTTDDATNIYNYIPPSQSTNNQRDTFTLSTSPVFSQSPVFLQRVWVWAAGRVWRLMIWEESGLDTSLGDERAYSCDASARSSSTSRDESFSADDSSCYEHNNHDDNDDLFHDKDHIFGEKRKRERRERRETRERRERKEDMEHKECDEDREYIEDNNNISEEGSEREEADYVLDDAGKEQEQAFGQDLGHEHEHGYEHEHLATEGEEASEEEERESEELGIGYQYAHVSSNLVSNLHDDISFIEGCAKLMVKSKKGKKIIKRSMKSTKSMETKTSSYGQDHTYSHFDAARGSEYINIKDIVSDDYDQEKQEPEHSEDHSEEHSEDHSDIYDINDTMELLMDGTAAMNDIDRLLI
ncbi:hypothetical protein ADUPG1_011385, partial [Aduncisulcus paluster]